jgi:hypothetical protein
MEMIRSGFTKSSVKLSKTLSATSKPKNGLFLRHGFGPCRRLLELDRLVWGIRGSKAEAVVEGDERSPAAPAADEQERKRQRRKQRLTIATLVLGLVTPRKMQHQRPASDP